MSQAFVSGPRVVHAVDAGGMYGIERMLLALLPSLRRRGFDARLLALNAPEEPGAVLAERLAAEDVPVFLASSGRWPTPRRLARLWLTLDNWRPVIVHTHGYKATIIVGAVGLVQRRRMICTQHTEALRYPKFARHLMVESRLIARFDRLVAVSEGVCVDLQNRGIPEHGIRVIPNGIGDPRTKAQHAKESRAAIRVLFLGRLVEGKDVHLLIEAIRRLRKEGLPVELVIAGDGSKRVELEEQASRAGLEEPAVRFLGFVAEPETLLAEADLFVLPTQHEGLPISILEAMAFGLPIVVSGVGGVPSVVRHRREGMLVAAGVQESLDEALRELVLNPLLRAHLGRSARDRFEQAWTADVMAERYARLYREVISGHVIRPAE